jgi:Flp pilus assembly protein CpaB
MFKKLLVLPVALASVFFFASAANAAESTSSSSVGSLNYSAAPQWRGRQRRQVLVSYQTRNVRVGRRVYRETYRVTQRPNGRVITQLISRTQIR